MVINLVYRIKKFFSGENGIVERVEPLNSLDKNRYSRDDDGNLPERIFIRNPLGEIVERTNPMILKSQFKRRGLIDYQIYKQYNVGDKFP